MTTNINSNLCFEHLFKFPQKTDKPCEAYQSFSNHRSFYKGSILDLLSNLLMCSKQFSASKRDITSKAACGHWIYHNACGRCGFLPCPMKCRCYE